MLPMFLPYHSNEISEVWWGVAHLQFHWFWGHLLEVNDQLCLNQVAQLLMGDHLIPILKSLSD